MYTVTVQSFHQWSVFPFLWLFKSCLFYEKEWTTFRVFRVHIKTDAREICQQKTPKSRVQLPKLHQKSLFPFHRIFRRCCKTGWTQSKDCSEQRPTRKKKTKTQHTRRVDGCGVIDSIKRPCGCKTDARRPAGSQHATPGSGSANLFRAHICSNYGVWIWTRVWQRRSKIVVFSGGLARINGSAMRGKSCKEHQ